MLAWPPRGARAAETRLKAVAGGADSHNELSSAVTGSVVQAGRIQQVVLPRPRPHQAPPVPRMLPPAIRDFTGRAEELALLDSMLPTEQPERPAGAAAVVVLDGTAGVGKSTLAVWWAHRAQRRFPGGTLFVNLRGYGPSAPLDPLLVLASFLSALGVAEDRVPADLDTCVGLYRSMLADRRVLLLFDNAATADQVRPLLPGAVGCLVLVTSRASLTGLVVSEAARQVSLELFTRPAARQLVRGIIGADRSDAEDEAVDELIRVCARLPLALRVAATRLAARRFLTVAEVVSEIVHDRCRLGVLSNTGDERSAVRSVFDWSYRRLSDDQARAFRRLGLHPGPEFGVHAAAALTDLECATVYRHLESLVDMHLVEPVGPRRYRFHDLLRAYAIQRAQTDDAPEQRDRARLRVVRWYARTAQRADRLVFPGLIALDVAVGPEGEDLDLADRAWALAWLNLEWPNLTEALRLADRHRWYDAAICLAGAARFLTFRERALWPARPRAHSLGLAAALACQDRAARIFLLGARGDAFCELGRWEDAMADYTRELALGERLDDPLPQWIGLAGLGRVELLRNRLGPARQYFERALPVVRRLRSPRSEAVVESNLSEINSRLGEYQQALARAERELGLRRQAGDRVGEAYALHNAVLALQGLGRHRTAVEVAGEAVTLNQTLAGTRRHTAELLEAAAESFEQLGDAPGAVAALDEAVSILEALAEPHAGVLRQRVGRLRRRLPGAGAH